MADVFISYAREDRDSAEQLAKAIESRGWTVWWDRRLLGGQQFAEVIDEELKRAKCVVLLWTRHAQASKWVRNEATVGDGRDALIPILLEDLPLHTSFIHLQACDLTGWTSSQLENCFESIEAKIARATHVIEPPDLEPPVIGKLDETPPIDPPPPPKPWHRWESWTGLVIGLTLVVLVVLQTSTKKHPRTANDQTTIADTSTMLSRDPIPFITTGASTATTKQVSVKKDVVDLQTSAGTITIELFAGAAPDHVRRFLEFAHSGGFEGSAVRYITKDAILAGPGSPERPLTREPNDIARVRGIVMSNAWVNSADAGTEFLIVFRDVPAPGRTNTVFGRVIAGMDVVDKIVQTPVDAEKRPLTPIAITRAVVRERNARGL